MAILFYALCLLSLEAEVGLKSVRELRELEQRIKSVSEGALPATVSIYSKNVGSSGSGVIISEEGLILTAGHVVQGLEEVTIVFPDGEETKGKVLGANLGRDSAMVQLQEEGPWPFVEMGDSSKLKIGDFVIAMGHAGGYDAVRTPPVRFGRIVGKDQRGFVSTDCTLIGGDSGGPLLDLKGRVVAIHSSIGGELDANHHTGVDNFKSDWDDLISGKNWGILQINPLVDPDRPMLGIVMAGSVRGGVLIGEVVDDSPAEMSGLQAGDIIRKIDRFKVSRSKEIIGIILEKKAGDLVTVDFLRAGELKKAKVRLARLADLHEDDE